MITIVPTSHVAGVSKERIKEAIDKFSPEYVAIELDPGRIKKGRRKKIPFKGKKGIIAGVLVFVQKRYAKKAGTEAGVDMFFAKKYAEEKKIKVLTVDRPVSETLSRISEVLSLRDILRIIYDALRGEELSFDIKEIPEEEDVSVLLRELKERYPRLYKVLVEERDEYIAKQLKEVENAVLVIGAGHVRGVKKRLENEEKKVQVFKAGN